jgi:hypothetical protein
MVLIEFGLTIEDFAMLCDHGQILVDHFDHRTSIWPNGQKIVVIGPPY